jgi:DNA helicase-2/ATP-dependent DNA helicase PcrA
MPDADAADSDLRARIMERASDLLSTLDEDQREGVLAGEGLTILQAGAGTGKTHTLTTRIAALIRAGEHPRGILAVTFTRDAARQMRERAMGLGMPGIEDVRFSTLHALSARILRRHWQSAGLASPDFIIADPDERREIAGEAVDAAGLLDPACDDDDGARARARRDLVRRALSCIDRWKENGLDAAMVLEPGRVPRSGDEETFAALYVGYQERLAARGLLDFGDLALKATAVLQSYPSVLEAEASAIRWMHVDEWQDTNRIQLRLVNLLASRGASVSVIGDDDQSLYSFRGAIERLMEQTAALMPEVAARGLHRVRLVTNRRCTEQILAPAVLMVDYNTREDPKVLRSGRHGSPVTVGAHLSDRGEGEDTARRIASLIAGGASAGEIAVLARTGAALEETVKALVRHGLPHVLQAGRSLFERREVLDITAYLKLAVDPSHDLAFQRIAARPIRGIGPEAVLAVLGRMRAHRIPIHRALVEAADVAEIKGKGREGARVFAADLLILADAVRTDEAAEDMIRYVLDRVGYTEWVNRKDPPETFRDSVRQLLDMARARPRIVDFLNDVSLAGEAEQRAEGAVHVGTLHGSKGLEWDHVIIVAFEDGIIPSGRAMEEAEERSDPDDPWCITGGGGLEEERRLAHVGLTRARTSAHISFATQRMVFGKPKPSRASRLLHEAELEVPRPRASPGQTSKSRPQAKKSAHRMW